MRSMGISAEAGLRGRRLGRVAAIGVALTAAAVASGGTISAFAASQKAPVPGRPASSAGAGKAVLAPAAPDNSLAGLAKGTIVTSAPFTATNGVQTRGSVTCPSSKPQPASGGAILTSSDLNVNINSSFPSGSSWLVDANNASGADTTFVVYAVCMKVNAKYTVTSAAYSNPNGSQTSGSASCPAHTVVRGGGALSSTGSTSANINTSEPSGSTGWRVDMNNASGLDATFTVYAVCGSKPKGYTTVFGTLVTNANGTETFTSVSCPAGSPNILGGGGFSASGSTAVDMNSNAPLTNGWRVWENNNSGADTTLLAVAICIT